MLHQKALGFPLHLAELPDAPNTWSQDCTSVCTMMAAHTRSARAPSRALPGSAALGIHLYFLPGFFFLPRMLQGQRGSQTFSPQLVRAVIPDAMQMCW